MKNLLIIIVLFITVGQDAHAQTLAFALQANSSDANYYSPANFASYRQHRRLGPITITGGVMACVGFVTTIVGGVVYLVNDLVYYDPANGENPRVNSGKT